jgi:hypothetical protein
MAGDLLVRQFFHVFFDLFVLAYADRKYIFVSKEQIVEELKRYLMVQG